jgi:hypothetical protein
MPDTTTNGSVNAPVGTPGHEQAYDEYKLDQLQQARVAMDHGAALRNKAPQRIAAAKQAVEAYTLAAPAALAVDPATAHYHAVERMLDERAFYPALDQRKESPGYAKMHKQMTVTDDIACLVCGVRHSTLSDPAHNPFGAIQLETHHHVIEWALANAIDPAKFNQRIVPGLRRMAQRRAQDPAYAAKSPLYKEFDAAYQGVMDLDTIKQWIDHAADNLWVLCDIHHRHKYVGIHAITYPIWGPQDVVESGLAQQQIDAAKSGKTDKPAAKPAAVTGKPV